MKLMYGNVPVKALNINYFEQDTNDCDMIASDLQAGKTAVARGQKIVGTGKSFEFASYGSFATNNLDYVPTNINVIHIFSLTSPFQLAISLNDMKHCDFSVPTEVGNIFVDGISYPIYVSVNDNLISITCEQTIELEVFYGKDNYS